MMRRLIGFFGLLLIGLPALADGPIEKIPQLDLKVRAVAGAPKMEPREMSISEDEPKEIRFGWDLEPQRPVEVTLQGKVTQTAVEGAMSLQLRASLQLPDGRVIQTSRTDRISERATLLFELYRFDNRPITLAIDATVGETWRAVRTPSVGRPVVFDVEVMLVDGDSEVAVERNELSTFEGQSVRYEMFGDDPEESGSLTLRLTPIRLIGDLIEVRVQLSGEMEVDGELDVVGSDENVIINRGSSTPVDLIFGDPPRGVRFRVSPSF